MIWLLPFRSARTRALLTGGALCGVLSLIAVSTDASAGVPATIAGKPVPTHQVQQGVARCARDAGELPLGECIERFEAPLWRLDQEALHRFGSQTPLRAEAERRALAERLIELLLDTPQDDDAIQTFLAEHTSEWKKPERIRVFRILVATREQASQLIAELADKSVADFRAAARAHSLDRSSHERGGDLGFVAADGSTEVPTVSVAPDLFAAAGQVEDGAFVPVPVPEGPHFAVVWRRGSLPAHQLDPSEARARALARLREQKAKAKLELLLEARPAERHPELLARFSRSECALFRP